MNPIENAFSKLKAYLRKIAERTVAGLMRALEACAINALDEDANGALSVSAKSIGGPFLLGRIWEWLGIVSTGRAGLMQRTLDSGD